MNNDKVYAVELSSGWWDYCCSWIHFASHDEVKCERWIDRYNKLLDKGREFYTSKYSPTDGDEDEDWWDKYIQFQGAHPAILIEIEIR